MARVYIVLPGGKVKRMSNRINGHCHDGRDYYRLKKLPPAVRDQRAREEAAGYQSSSNNR